MDKHPEQPRQYLLTNPLKVLRKRLISPRRKHGLAINLILDPVHEQIDVLICGEGGRLLVLGGPVRPQVLELWASGHCGAGLVGAVVADCAVD